MTQGVECKVAVQIKSISFEAIGLSQSPLVSLNVFVSDDLPLRGRICNCITSRWLPRVIIIARNTASESHCQGTGINREREVRNIN